jgi:hypothetical protein
MLSSALQLTLVLATADLLFACSYWRGLYGVPPTRVMQGIAAGLLGKRAFVGGAGTAALGGLLHYLIMGVMVGAYYAASRRMAGLSARPWLYGSLYGCSLYLVMNLIVVPLSAAPKAPLLPGWIVSSLLVHLALGWVIALTRAGRLG